MISWTKVLILVLAAHMALSIALEESHDIRHEFCWKDSYGRGVGKIPKHCKNRDRIGLLCYDRCPRGFKRWGFDCHQISSADMLNIGEEDSPGNGVTVSPARGCTEDVRLSTEEEDVRSGVQLFIPNANPVTTILRAASADLGSPIARVLA